MKSLHALSTRAVAEYLLGNTDPPRYRRHIMTQRRRPMISTVRIAIQHGNVWNGARALSR